MEKLKRKLLLWFADINVNEKRNVDAPGRDYKYLDEIIRDERCKRIDMI